ncbi:MAG TPA: DUF1778 domain-containing protein [Oleiagrimonas sp.]|nr:DUF1778 domain-containing protein [Oleiagrimonas sp.]
MPITAEPHESTINLRAPTSGKALIDQAAKALDQSRSSFMLEASIQRAETVLSDRTRFTLDAEGMRRFNAALDAPLPDPDALRRLMARTAPWAR